MKKYAIIAMCCISVLFASCNKENPNEKFVGDWYGTGVATGTMTMSVMGQEFVQDFDNIEIPMSINLAAGEAKNEVILTYTSEEMQETYTAKGIVNDYDVDFDPIDLNMNVQGTTVTATLDLMGTLSSNKDILSINGTVSGQGNYAVEGSPLPIPYTASGTVAATLNRGTAPAPAPYNGPTITLLEEENCITEGTEVVAGELFFVALSCEGKALNDLKLVFVDNDNNVLEEWSKELNNADEFTCAKYFTINQVGDVTLTATLTDSQDKVASLNVNFKVIPAPEPSFEAHYQGTVNLDATASAMMLSYPINVDYDMDILLSEVEEEGQINAIINFAGNNYTTTGTKDGNVIDLEPFDVALDFEGSTVDATIDMNGTIGDGVLGVQGDLTGSGNINFSGFNVPATIEGTVSGDLNEVE